MTAKGYIALEGGAEFGGRMADPDRRAIELAGGPDVPIAIIPAAAAPDKNHLRAGQNGVQWFERLGASNVSAVPLIDESSADEPKIAETLSQSKLIYLLGGFPHYLGQTLSGSRSWQGILSAFRSGAVIAGSSAGAMVLCDYYYDPVSSRVFDGLKLVKRICILPHYNTFGREWVASLKERMSNIILLGIDEETGAIGNSSHGRWQVYGKGKITLHHIDRVDAFSPEQEFVIENKPK